MTSMALAGERTFSSLRRHHNYRLFFAGQGISVAGSWMQNVALVWLVIQLSDSPLAVGALAFCRFLPFTFLGLCSEATSMKCWARLSTSLGRSRRGGTSIRTQPLTPLATTHLNPIAASSLSLSMARAVNDDKLSREILKTAADEVKARLA